MLDNDNIDKKTYSDLMEEIKKLNSDYQNLRRSKNYKIGKAINMTVTAVKTGKLSQAKKQFLRWENAVRSKRFAGIPQQVNQSFPPSNYFTNERIAVYTVVFGKYDSLLEPYCHPDNIDYYLITDQDVDLDKSLWVKKDISVFEPELKEMTNAEKNRFFKMNPFDVFPEYKYSIYIDGNIQVITDLSEYIYRIGSCGFAAHMHSSRDCVYEESKAIVFAKKETQENMDKHIEHLRNDRFPEHYGMLECNVLVRRNCPVCKKLMKEWWKEFLTYSKRDQISMPYILYKNGIQIDEVGTLGNNVYENPSFRIVTHN